MPIKFAVSNLAWSANQDVSAVELLSTLGVRGVEVAPTRIADWSSLTDQKLINFREVVHNFGLSVYSLQSLLFNLPSIQLLGDQQNFNSLENHFHRLAYISNILGAKILIFGSPLNRKLCDHNESVAWEIALTRMNRLGKIASSAGLIIGIEPVPRFYGNQLLTSWMDVLKFVKELKNNGVMVHLDTACVGMNGDSIREAIYSCAESICHFQIAQPKLENFATPHPDHSIAAEALKELDYSKWVSLEMKESKLSDILHAIKYVKSCYIT